MILLKMDKFVNQLYCCDNLELLKQLPSNSVDLVYADVLYATGRNFGEYQDLKYDKQEVYDFYTPRIEEIYRILSEKGTMILQCDWRIDYWLRDISDNFFGYKNCTNIVYWKYNSGGSSNKHLNSKNDTIIIFAKNPKKQTFNPMKEKSYNRGLKKYGFKGIEEFEDEIGWFTWVNMRTIWDIPMVGRTSSERVDYATQKPKKLLKRIIELYTNEGDVVADFFLGSGTTVVVAKELNRQFIGCDISERSIEITKNRLDNI